MLEAIVHLSERLSSLLFVHGSQSGFTPELSRCIADLEWLTSYVRDMENKNV